MANIIVKPTQRATVFSTTTFTGAGDIQQSVNTAIIQANAAFTQANIALSVAQSAYNQANTGSGSLDQTARNTANAAFDRANSANILAQAAFNQANTGSGSPIDQFARNTANSANVLAQSSYDTANTKVNRSGDTITGSLDILGQVNVTQRLSVGGGGFVLLPNLISQFTGYSDNYSQVNQQNLSGLGTGDFVVTSDNGTDAVNYIDMGIAGATYDNTTFNALPFVYPNDGYFILVGNQGQTFGGNVYYGTAGSGTLAGGTRVGDIVFVQGEAFTEIARFAMGGGFKLKAGITSSSNSTGTLVVQGGAGIAGAVRADSVFDGPTRILTLAQGAFNQANSANVLAQAAFNQANTTVTDLSSNVALQVGINATQNTYTQAAFDKANTDVTNISTNAGTYGNTSYVPVITVAANGRIINIVNTAISGTGGGTTDQFARDTANSANVLAQSAFNQANTTVTNLTSNVALQVSINATQNTYTQAAFNRANLANVLAQSAYNTANTGYNFVTSGGTVAGSVTIQNNLTVQGNVNFIGNVTSVAVTGNTGQFFGYASNGYNALYAGIPTGYLLEPQIVFQMSSNYDGYSGLNMQNINTGANSSSDLFITADNGTALEGFVDLGIASSNYNYSGYTLIGPNDGYLFAYGNTSTGGGDMIVATGLNNDIIFATRGLNTENEVMRITAANTVVIKTTNTSISTTTGALQVKGGLGVVGNVYAGAVYSSGTLVLTSEPIGQAAFNKANSANVLAQAGFDQANTDVTNINITAGTYGNTSYVPVITVAANGRIVSVVNTAISGTGGSTTDQFARDKANSANILAQSAFAQANLDFTNISTTAGVYGNNTIIPVITLAANGRVTNVVNTTIRAVTNLANDETLSATATTGDITIGLKTIPTVTAGQYSYPLLSIDSYGRVVQISNQTPLTSVAGITSGTVSNTALIEGIKTVDGTGSGLDADLLDGNDSAYFSSLTYAQAIFNSSNTVASNLNTEINLQAGINQTQNTNTTNVDTKAQAAFTQANLANVLAQAAFGSSNTVSSNLNDQINLQIGINASQNTSISNLDIEAQAAFNQANTDVTTINTTAGTYGNTSYVPVITVAANGRISSVTTAAVSGGGGGATGNSEIIYVIDGGGAAITTGLKGALEVPFNCNVVSWTLLSDQTGSVTMNIFNESYAAWGPSLPRTNPINFVSVPILSSQSKNNISLGTQVAIASGNLLSYNVFSSSVITRLSVCLKVTKT
jgi:hypothetical protein